MKKVAVCHSPTLSAKGISHANMTEKKVAVIGAGGIGSHLVEELIRTGFTDIVVYDGDVVEESNLSRQNFTTSDIGESKTNALLKRLDAIVAHHNCQTIDEYLVPVNLSYLEGCELIFDATDNLKTRYLINQYAFQHNIPWIYASAIGTMSATAAFIPGKTPCFECVFGPFVNETEMSCSLEGVLLPTLKETISRSLILGMKILGGLEVSSSIVTKDVWTNSQSEFDFSFLQEASCGGCKTEKSASSTLSYISMKCRGNGIDVWVEDTSSISSLIADQFSLNRTNELFSEFTHNEKRVLIFANKKLTFHGFQEKEVISLFS